MVHICRVYFKEDRPYIGICMEYGDRCLVMMLLTGRNKGSLTDTTLGTDRDENNESVAKHTFHNKSRLYFQCHNIAKKNDLLCIHYLLKGQHILLQTKLGND